jgi:ribose transport system ATP-binding protein
MVEIAKALSQKARILVMDEPTSSLSLQEMERLHALIRELRTQGISVIYISHRLSEVLDVTDRILVLRDGERVGEILTRDADHDTLVRMMVGRSIGEYYTSRHEPASEPAISVRNLLPPGFLHPVSFEVRRGEILGFAGLVGAGRTEVFRSVFGLDPPLSGEVRILGNEARIEQPRDAVRAGIGYVPEDRKLQGVILEMAVDENVNMARIGIGSYLDRLRPREEKRLAGEYAKQLRIRTPSLDQPVMALSGGNQQKVVLAKWLALAPQVLILDEPTRGIDVGSKSEIYALMDELSRRGVGIVMISSEMEEIVGMSDRAAVMWQRRITGILEKREISEEAIMRLATGKERD